MGFLFNRNPIEVYEHNILYFVIDFLGLANLFATPSMNSTWWFMSLIIIIYILFPLFIKLFNYSSELFLLVSLALLLFYFIPDIVNLRIYLFSFVLGMYFSKNNIFQRIQLKFDTKLKVFAVSFLVLIITLWLKATIFIKSV